MGCYRHKVCVNPLHRQTKMYIYASTHFNSLSLKKERKKERKACLLGHYRHKVWVVPFIHWPSCILALVYLLYYPINITFV